MRNRAKCKLCGDILESFHRHDYISCVCGEIAIDGGLDYFKASAKDWNNFLRIDDEDKEVPISVINNPEYPAISDKNEEISQNRSETSLILNEMIGQYQNLPQHAMLQPATNADILSLLYLFKNLIGKALS